MSLSTIVVAILVFLTIHEDSAVGDKMVNLRCHCITKERKPIGRHILVLEVHPASSHCAETQIIATLKKGKRKVCLDPNAPWVIRVMQNRRAKQKVQEQTAKA
ncbi:C-X-C motif chemokine 2-like [Poecilia latipinna]|uniref:C-X-C motif chemokine 2-like n=1 Tax=Poecilia latipinna TaxID=48699 RepID=A0A3B3UZM2_9TELE|nr:PREDICTED: C-X-C motif chemokine 2-like [Poecilia latipinna]